MHGQGATRKLNCWEFKDCGREPGGARVEALGVCPAAREYRLEGINGGLNSGRICWLVAGTFCKGEVQGSFAGKQKSCEACAFFKLVAEEEGEEFARIHALLRYLSEAEAAEREGYRRLLEKVLDPGVLKEALRDLDSLKQGMETEISAFFTDLASFSAISEILGPGELSKFLGEYLGAMTAVLTGHGGTLDKYIGDALIGDEMLFRRVDRALPKGVTEPMAIHELLGPRAVMGRKKIEACATYEEALARFEAGEAAAAAKGFRRARSLFGRADIACERLERRCAELGPAPDPALLFPVGSSIRLAAWE